MTAKLATKNFSVFCETMLYKARDHWERKVFSKFLNFPLTYQYQFWQSQAWIVSFVLFSVFFLESQRENSGYDKIEILPEIQGCGKLCEFKVKEIPRESFSERKEVPDYDFSLWGNSQGGTREKYLD